MIALDPDRTTDPDYPVSYQNSKLGPDAPVWCRYVWVRPEDGDEPYMDDVPPYGKTVVAKLQELGDVDDINALDDEQPCAE